MKKNFVFLISILSILLLTGCNGSGGSIAVVNDTPETIDSGYSVEGYLGVDEITANAASPKNAVSNGNLSMIFYFGDSVEVTTKEVEIRDNYYSVNDLETRPSTIEVYENTTLIATIPFDTQPISDTEKGASVEYKLKLMLKKDSVGVNQIEYGFLKYMEKGSQILRCLGAATANGSSISGSNFDFSDVSKIYNIDENNRARVRKRMQNEYQEFITSKLDSLKERIRSQIEYLIPEIDANVDTSIILNEDIELPDVEQETISGIISDAQAVGDSISFTRTGDANWHTTVADRYEGNSCLVSGYIDNEQSTTIKSTIVGPGRLSFMWKVWSEKSDYLKFLIDDVVIDSVSGKTDWQGMGYYIEDGTHEIAWTYVKDFINSEGYDCGKIDVVVYEKGSFVEMPTDLVASNITSSSAQLSWTGSNGASGYNIYLDDTKLNTELITANTYDLTGLDQLTRYKVVVSAIPTSTSEVSISTAPYFFTTKTSITVKEALDITSSDIQISYDDTKCVPQIEVTSDGVDAVKITKLSSVNNSPRKGVSVTEISAGLVLTVNGPGKLTFDWKMNEGDQNNVLIANISSLDIRNSPARKSISPVGSTIYSGYHTDWITKELIIPSGFNKVYFYIGAKQTSSDRAPGVDDRFYGETAGFLDKVSFESGEYASSPSYYSLNDITDSSFILNFNGGFNAPRRVPVPISATYNYYLNDELYIEDTTSTTITFDGLDSDSLYSVCASAVLNGLESPRSDKAYFKTLKSGYTIKDSLNSSNLDQFNLRGKAIFNVVDDETASNGKALKISKIDMDDDNNVSLDLYMRDGLAYDKGFYTIRYKVNPGLRLSINAYNTSIYSGTTDGWIEKDFYYTTYMRFELSDLKTADNAYILVDSIVKKDDWNGDFTSYVSMLKVNDYGNGTCEVSFGQVYNSFDSIWYRVDVNDTPLYTDDNKLYNTSFELDIEDNTLYKIDVTPVTSTGPSAGIKRTIYAYNETGFDSALNKGSDITWKTYGGSSWKVIDSSDATYGSSLVKSGTNGGNVYSSYLEGAFSDTGEIKIRFKTDLNEITRDILSIRLDGSTIYTVNCDIDWIEVSRDVNEGDHTIEFAYTSSDSGDEVIDEKVLIDYVEFIREQ